MTDFVDTGVLYPDHDTDATSVALCRRHDVDAILRTLDSILLIADLVQPIMSEIVSTEDTLGGAPRIEGRRIGVHHVAKRVIDAGEPPEQVAADYDPDIADVHRALAYYYDNPEEMQEVQRQRSTVPDGSRGIRGPDDLDEEEPEQEA